ncbi:Activator of Hsp90 ATPase homolog 1-like protein [Mycobacteroides abscessus subsp. bolletii]|nr:Activator of Hsp90 ATPase homolog 1-like protein [Mycobacteroides abscessus subsp. bolletii]SKU84739.1 Activator of Hsp90 ATPase homolog 1-like protein [Mycobacteroides abscessus subsp. bolletii]SKY73492.1 Activator of Hsp90 ATPase homolog 1-like protein [Mycobacteroides abscessus subsp. bolletii]SLF62361.1 Activator of Hsp90 ATPase homolog 1-like protein [Mycobacteroides abscessus subsp. bolletii]
MTNPLDATLAPCEDHEGRWVLTMSRDLNHPPETVWPWLVDPDRLRQWSPAIPDRPLDSAGPANVQETSADPVLDGEVLTVDPPRELIHRWGPDDTLRWRIEPTDTGCRLTLEHSMADRSHAAGNAGGWHICLDTLGLAVDGTPRGRVVGMDAMKYDWQSLNDRYTEILTIN